MASMAGGPATFEIAFACDMTRMRGKTLISHDARTLMAAVAECICEAVFDYVIASGIIVNQQSLILGAMGATWRVGIIATMTVTALDHGDVISSPLFLTIGA